ncbi:MAG: sugar ABC transporter ATP-binding protein [Armatimonadota bacterium]
MIEATGLTKAFGTNVALDAFDITIQAGEIIGVIGENGAGKSTFMKLLSGVHRPSGGSISIHNEIQTFATPREAIAKGIAMVHQELNLIPTLSVADNIFLGREKGSVTVNRKDTDSEAAELLKLVGASFGPETLCGDLSVAQQQLVEIAKAISQKPKLIIFDEPTAVLGEQESLELFALIRGLKDQGVAVLYVSHRLPEILSLTDRLVVLRDGVKVGEYQTQGQTESSLADLMVGRPLADIFPSGTPDVSPEIALEIQNLSSLPLVKDISLTLHRGEILGIAGLIGSGRTEFAEALVGLRPGAVEHIGPIRPIKSYQEAISQGIVYISEDRKGKSLVTTMSIRDNICLAALRVLKGKLIQQETTKTWIEKLGIKVADMELPMTSLSGGNQQKCAIAKWLAVNPKILILDEPTRGVDVGAKAEIYSLIAKLAQEGMSCIVISSEMPEIIGLCHRALVFRDGRVEGELQQNELTEANIMRLAAGIKEGVKAA